MSQIEEIDVVRYEDGVIHVLGIEAAKGRLIYSLFSNRQFYHIIHNAETGEIIEEDSFNEKVGDYAPAYAAGIGALILGLSLPSFIDRFRNFGRERESENLKNILIIGINFNM